MSLDYEDERRAFVEQYALAGVALVLAEAIDRSGMKQYDLAERLGVSEARVSQLLAADANPTASELLGRALSLLDRVVAETGSLGGDSAEIPSTLVREIGKFLGESDLRDVVWPSY